MVTLVIGGSGSGKSAYAERLLEEAANVKHKYYVATMQVFDEGGKQKVEKHRRARQGKGFLTIEQPRHIEQAARRMERGENAALLECMSNLAANEMFGDTVMPVEETIEKVLGGVRLLASEVKQLIIVTNNVFEDGIRYDEGTMDYMKALARINEALVREADVAVEVVAGLPITLKCGVSL